MMIKYLSDAVLDSVCGGAQVTVGWGAREITIPAQGCVGLAVAMERGGHMPPPPVEIITFP